MYKMDQTYIFFFFCTKPQRARRGAIRRVPLNISFVDINRSYLQAGQVCRAAAQFTGERTSIKVDAHLGGRCEIVTYLRFNAQ